jgi:putative Ca2+/H+ antiporter (TMEM165/GDT1 family)
VNANFATGFVIVFLIIGGLELFDRTSFALIAYSSRAHSLASWVGASAAFTVTSALAVSVGAALIDALGPSRIGLVRIAGGIFLIGYAAWVFFHPEDESTIRRRDEVRSALLAAFATILLLEIGDDTMIFEIIFVANWGWLIVFVAGTLALVTLAAWNVFLGRTLGRRISPQLLNRIVVVVLTIVGALTILYGLEPTVFPSLGLAAVG